MRSYLLLLSTAALSLTAMAGSASAQSFGIYVGPPAPYDDYYANTPSYAPPYSYGPRVYGYVRRSDELGAYDRPRYRGGRCGMYRYWDGDRCVDARYR
jgi:hypothetical protein